MNIIVGKNAGFCFGVKRAVDGTMNIINNDKNVYCLGELVHNKEVVKRVENKGITIINDINEIEDNNALVIIRAHGVSKNIYEELEKRNIEVIDYTCPNVKKIHEIVNEYKNNGYYIMLVGSKNHPEIIGTASYCGSNMVIIENEMDVDYAIDLFNKSGINNLLVIVQTTFSKKIFDIIENKIKIGISKDKNVVIKNTICNATDIRQKEAKELSKKVDLMIIIGGSNSSNTKKLYDIAKENTDAIMIENYKELDLKIVEKYDNIGIVAGTSTPKEEIDDVIKALNN